MHVESVVCDERLEIGQATDVHGDLHALVQRSRPPGHRTAHRHAERAHALRVHVGPRNQPIHRPKAIVDHHAPHHPAFPEHVLERVVFGVGVLRSPNTEDDALEKMLWEGRVLWGMMVYDSLVAMDWLVTRPNVDINCLTDFQALIAHKGLHLHGIYYYVPSLLEHFTTSQINELIAPRAHLGLAGLRDTLTPVDGLDRIDRDLQQAYSTLGHPERWKLLRYDVEHQETPEGRQAITAFLKQWL